MGHEQRRQHLAVRHAQDEGRKAQGRECRVEDRGDLGVGGDAETAAADDVHVALVELAEPPALGALSAPDFLYLVPAEGEGQLLAALGDVAREGDGEVEVKAELDVALRQLRRVADRVDLGLDSAGLLRGQHVPALDSGRLNRRVTEKLVLLPHEVQEAQLGEALRRQPLGEPGDRVYVELVRHGGLLRSTANGRNVAGLCPQTSATGSSKKRRTMARLITNTWCGWVQRTPLGLASPRPRFW